MLKSHLAVLLLGMLAGGVSGYIAGNSTQKELPAEISSLQIELRAISNQLSAFRYSDNRGYPEYVEPLQNTSIDHESLLREIDRSIRDTVSQAIQEQLQEEFASLRRQIQGAGLAATPTVTAYDEEKMRAGIEQADAVLSQAVSQGVWTQYDKQAFDDALRNLSGNALMEARRKFAVAINNGDIVLGKGVTPF